MMENKECLQEIRVTIEESIKAFCVIHEYPTEHREFIKLLIEKEKRRNQILDSAAGQLFGWGIIGLIGVMGIYGVEALKALLKQ